MRERRKNREEGWTVKEERIVRNRWRNSEEGWTAREGEVEEQ